MSAKVSFIGKEPSVRLAIARHQDENGPAIEHDCSYIGESPGLVDTHHSRLESSDSSHTQPGLLRVRSMAVRYA